MGKLSVINGLRGMALLMVVFHHLPIHAWFQTRFVYLFEYTYTGVNLFFILSGFVLYRYYLLNNIQSLTMSETWLFYKKRFFRLYPLFLLNGAVLVFFLYGAQKEYVWAFVKALTTYSVFTDTEFMPSFNWVLWSLMMEIWFSILFPILLWMISKTSIYKAGAIVLFISLVSRLLPQLFPSVGHAFAVLSRLDDFYVGFLVCYLFYQKRSQLIMYQKMMFWGSIFVLFVACLYSYLVQGSYFSVVGNNFFQIGFVMFTLSLLLSDGWDTKLFSFKPLQLLGMMCFSIYVWHGVLIKPLISEQFNALDYPFYFVALFVLSSLTYRFVEFGQEPSFKKLYLLEKGNK
jgi:peptidoglycan/LPS O-acetylase OafA/YrhL